MNEISGGELQRVAIAACVLKKANLYIFDEPTSYLDIKQRVKISKFIKSLANEETAVLLVEHDLIVLDHTTDLIHLMYGEEAAYGVVSQPKPTRVAINVYLEGYLKEENVRFRDNQIKFTGRQTFRRKETRELISWSKIKAQLGKFNLSAETGMLADHTVYGVLGENGIGKTSFVKILAGVTKAEGEISSAVKVSYKPQYIFGDSEETVEVVLQDAIQKYSNALVKALGLDRLMESKLNELSGGELQRVAIARCLSQDADLFLMDEPSAYLDVEQRLIVSKIIREQMELRGKSAFIVDHDLLFVDYLSDALVVFTGIPAESGHVEGPFNMEEGMNKFLSGLGITLRRDHESHRPRINKEDSQLDREQKNSGNLYYA